jgi:hypothetical protein
MTVSLVRVGYVHTCMHAVPIDALVQDAEVFTREAKC